MHSAHGTAPALGERNGLKNETAGLPAESWADDDPDTLELPVTGAGEPPRGGRRARPRLAEEPEAPYWATWGF